MIKTHAKLRAWGNSVGVVLPKEELKAEHLGPDDTVEITVRKRTSALREAFGKLKFKTPTDELLRKADEDMWSKY